MANTAVRIKNLSIRNFKNVKNGDLDFISASNALDDEWGSSVTGLYGQNGSGKTAVINALEFLQNLISGRSIPSENTQFINVDAKQCVLCVEFLVKTSDSLCQVWYQCMAKKAPASSNDNLGQISNHGTKVEVFNESLTAKFDGTDEYKIKTVFINTEDTDLFKPATKFKSIAGSSKKDETDILFARKIAQASSRSFIFLNETVNKIKQNCKIEIFKEIISALVKFVHNELYIIKASNTGLIALDALPLNFRFSDRDNGAFGSLVISLNNSFYLPKIAVDLTKKIIENLNIVLKELIPDLTLNVKELSRELNADANEQIQLQLLSVRNGRVIPFKFESDGIKKIVSILHLLICVHNNENITVAVDELDSGIFEYLLGEILRIIHERGLGQLIFTSHNLRPLETLNNNCIVFTTPNINRRYIRMKNVKATNNPRDLYYREIMLGSDDIALYEPTDNYKIELALRRAGESFNA